MMMYGEFDDCGHLLDEMYERARELGIEPQVVDALFDPVYWRHRRKYEIAEEVGGSDGERLRMSVNLSVQKNVLSELERLAEKES